MYLSPFMVGVAALTTTLLRARRTRQNGIRFFRSATDMPSDEDRIRTVVDTWQTATRAGDVDTVLGLMTDDAVFLVPGRPPMGKTEFTELSRLPPGAPRPTFESTSEIMEIAISGDMAYLWSRLSVSVTPPGADQPIERAGHTLTVFRRVDGQWRLARDANLLVVVPRRNT